MKGAFLCLAACCLLSGCAWRTQVERGIVSTSKIDFDNKRYEIDRSRKIEGADRAHGVWLIPLGSPDATDAVKKTIADANKNSKREIVGIADVEVKFRLLWLYLYSQRWSSVEGYPIYEKLPSAQ